MLCYGVNRQSCSASCIMVSNIRALSTTCFQCSGPLGSCSGPCLQWSGPLGSGSGPARVPFPMLGSDTPFEFYIDNAMRGGVGGVNHEICKIIFGNCSNVVVQRWFQTGRRQCTRAHTQRQRTALKGEVLEIDCHTRTPLLSL